MDEEVRIQVFMDVCPLKNEQSSSAEGTIQRLSMEIVRPVRHLFLKLYGNIW